MENNEVNEVSISDLESMLRGEEPAAETKKESSAAAGNDGARTSTDSETGDAAQGKTAAAERGADGKFRAKSEDLEPGDEALTPNAQKRIAQVTKARREAERERDELKAKLNGSGSQPATETATVKTPEKKAAPNADDFATYEEYTRAVARHASQEAIDEDHSRQRTEAENARRYQAEMARHKDFDAAEAEAKKTLPDYDDVTASIEWPKTPAMGPIADYLLDTKNATLLYQLGKHPSEIARIAALSPVQAIAALAKFEVQHATAEPPAPPAKKQLPKPPANVGGSASAKAEDLNDPDLPFDAFERKFKAALKAS